ncbi:MAG: DUF937 domain-containing protein [Rhodothermaceae bacterium]|nr:DUF937 domain-containing protein [Rhodothermaceae bacterium]
MNGILDLLAQNLGGPQMGQLAQTIGADERQTQQAIAAALPALMAGLNRNTNSPQGAESLLGALQQDHDGSLLDNLSGFLGGQVSGRQTDGSGILSHILGGQRPEVEQGVAQASGLDLSKVQRLLPILAPLVMAALGRRQRQGGLGPDVLSDLLGQESRRARQATPDSLLGPLGGFLDKDGDGDFKDDLMQQAGSAILSNLFGRR